jgi:hypothetical protein
MPDVYADDAELPTPPVNVRVHYLDGHEEPVDLVYEGLDIHGIHQWVATPQQPIVSRYASVKVDLLPPRSSISLRWED